MSTSISKDGAPLPPYEPDGTANLTPAIGLPDEVYRARVDVAVALRAQKLSTAEIAEVFKVQPSTVKSWFRRARAEGKISDGIDELLDKDTVFRALEVMHDRLEEGNLEAALAVLKGRGKFRNYNNNNAEGANQVTGIQIIYTTPSGAPPPALTDVATLPGQIVGTPRSDPQPVKAGAS